MELKKNYKSLNYYLSLPWTYTVEQGRDADKNKIYVVRVNELPGICTDATSLDEAMELIKEPMKAAFEFYMENDEEIPEPVNEEDFKGNTKVHKMTKERFKLSVFVCLILRKNEKILLIRRSNTGSGDGFYACAGGGVDGNEPITQAMIREADEELGIKLKKENLKVVHVVHSDARQGSSESVGFFVEATEWEGEPRNMEPHKHDDIGWFSLNDLPENTFPRLRHVLKMLSKKVFYSEYGWE